MVQKAKKMTLMLYIGFLILGVIAGVTISWFMMRTVPVPQPIIVVRDVATASTTATPQGPKMPVFPEKDPEYPLRNLSHTAEYQQVGVLKSMDGSEPVALPLFGRRMPNRPDRWEYYTATDKQNMLRVPIMYEERDCLEEVGCNELYKGDQVMVPVYDKMYEVQLYKYRM